MSYADRLHEALEKAAEMESYAMLATDAMLQARAEDAATISDLRRYNDNQFKIINEQKDKLDAADLLIEARDAQLEAMRVDRDQALRRGDRWQADAERWLAERDQARDDQLTINSLETQLATIKRNYDAAFVRLRETLDRWQTDAEGMAELLEETEAKLRKEARHSADIQTELDNERKDNELLRRVNSEWLAHSHADTDIIKMYVTSNYELIEKVERLEDERMKRDEDVSYLSECNYNLEQALERANNRLRGVQQAMSAFVPF